MQTGTIKIENGLEVGYRLTGDLTNPTIIFLNGSIFNYKQFDPVLFPKIKSQLGSKYSYLQYDYIGFGESSTDVTAFEFMTIAKQHLQVMDALGIDKAHHLGFSKGSLIGFLAAAIDKERLLSLVGYGSPNLAYDGNSEREFGKRLQNMKAISGIWKETVSEKNYKILYDTLYVPTIFNEKDKSELGLFEKIKSWWVHGKLKPMLMGTMIENIAKLFEYYKTEISDEEKERYRVAMKSLDIPVLLVHGTNDEIIPIAAAEQLHSMLPNSSFQSLPGYDHTSLFLVKRKGKKLVNQYVKFVQSLV